MRLDKNAIFEAALAANSLCVDETERERTMLAAVARPSGAGPFPSVLLLHGSHRFAQEYVQLAQELAKGGLLAMAAHSCLIANAFDLRQHRVRPTGDQLTVVDLFL